VKDINLDAFDFTGGSASVLEDLSQVDPEDRETLLMSGVDVEEKERSGTFLHMDHAPAYQKSTAQGLEIMDINQALEKYDGLKDHYWKLVDPEKDDFTRMARDNPQGGYFVRVKSGVQILDPVQSCLFMKANRAGQSVHNVVIVEDGAELHMITGCAVAKSAKEAAHIGISEFFVGKNAKLTFTMVHNWGEQTTVVPRSAGIVEEGGQFLSNYIIMKPVKYLQMYPAITLAGKGAVSRFNSVMVAPRGSHLDTGNRVFMNAPETRAEIISRTIAMGGTIIARGHIQGNHVPNKGHLECKGLILGEGVIHAIPELEGTVEGVELSHEAAVGKIAQEEIEYLMARGLDEDEATSTIVRGFLNVDIMGLPERLKEMIDKTIEESEEDMF
jgi:Fe-S cluster assembly scaffold protein SufB